ncbi:hypothetical protein FACS1894116_02450 [Betaproteobacteria bacterium]|nr:hypothetical protein FACS1894116_02450 [Betaproteobacteria bacterium]
MDEDLAKDVAKVISDKYALESRLLVTGHRKQDLLNFSADALFFTFSDKSGHKPTREVSVTQGKLDESV